MKLSNRLYFVMVILLLSFTSIVCTTSSDGVEPSPTPKDPLSAELSEITGLVQVLKPVEGFFKDAFNGQIIEVKDQVLTHQDSRVRIDLSNGTLFRVGPFSTFILEEIEQREEGPFAKLKLEIGKIWIILRGGAIDVETPSGLASVRGSYLYVEVLPLIELATSEPATAITCLEGTCSLECEGGKVNLGAGETGIITDSQSPPIGGKMSHKDVDEWIKMNPEATEVVIPLTATPTSTLSEEGQTPIQTWTPTMTYTPAATSENCGPPADWVIYTVVAGDDMGEISAAYGVSLEDLQFANCMGNSTALSAGDTIFVPNVPTMTPTSTSTSTKTPVPYKTSTPKPTKTPTKTSTKIPTKTSTPTDTKMPSNSNAVFFNIAGPPETITNCLNYYKTDVIDPDGISMVKLFYIVDWEGSGTSTEPAQGQHVVLDFAGGNSYSVSNFKISTADKIGTDIVYYRFMMIDALGYTQYYPALTDDPYFYYDSLDCGVVNYPTTFSGYFGPGIPTPISVAVCTNQYKVDVNDANGIELVELAYSLDAGSSYSYIIMNPHVVDGIGNGTWEITTSIDTKLLTPPVAVKYKFKAKDKLGNWTLDTQVSDFTYTIACTP